VNKKHPKSLKAEQLSPIGIGLAGALWQTTAQQQATKDDLLGTA
jgi:hypothetical protein